VTRTGQHHIIDEDAEKRRKKISSKEPLTTELEMKTQEETNHREVPMFMKDKRLACMLRLDWNERDSFLPIGMSMSSALYGVLFTVLFDSMACLPILSDLTYERGGDEAEPSKIPDVTIHTLHLPRLAPTKAPI
jgi:hypothetical protein